MPSLQTTTPDGKSRFASALEPGDRLQLVELHVNRGLSFRQTAEVWNQRLPEDSPKRIKHEAVRRIVRQELEAISEQMRGMVDAHRTKHDMQITQALNVAWQIALASKCSVCNGEKTIPKDRLDPSAGSELCPKCEGSGRNESDTVRLSALNTIKGLLERHAKLFGLDAPVVTAEAHKVLVAYDTSSIPIEGLAAEMAGMFGGPPVLEAGAVELDDEDVADGDRPIPAEGQLAESDRPIPAE